MSGGHPVLAKLILFLAMVASAAGVIYLLDFLYSASETPPPASARNGDDEVPEELRGPGAVLREDRQVTLTVEPGQRQVVPAEGGSDRTALFDVTPKEAPLQAAAIPVKSVLMMSADEEEHLARSYYEIRAGGSVPVRCEAKADEVGACVLRNAGEKPVTARVRVRSWTFVESAAGQGGDFTRIEVLESGRTLEFFVVATRPTRWTVDVTPKGGEVFAALAGASSARGLTSIEKSRLLDVVRRVPASSTEPMNRFLKIGEVGCCCLYNRGDKTISVEIRSHLGR